MSTQWKPLPLSKGQAHSPPLLVKHEVSHAGYTVFLADITTCSVWSESLDRREIFKRAWANDVSIDPSEGNDQLDLLLQKLKDALNGQAKTQMTLAHEDDRKLLLTLSASLPASLPLLVWPIHLIPASSDVFSAQLVLPCFSHWLSTKNQMNLLLTRLKDKDRIISRLMGKLQSAGLGLNAVFPSVTLKSGSTTELQKSLLSSVPGLREFDEAGWRSSIAKSCESPVNAQTAIESLFTADLSDVPAITTDLEAEHWWSSLSDRAHTENSSRVMSKDVSLAKARDVDINMSDEDFQTQSVPSSLSKRANQDVSSEDHAADEPAEKLRSRSRSISDSMTNDSTDDDLDRGAVQHDPLYKKLKEQVTYGGNRPFGDAAPTSGFELPATKKIGILGGKRQEIPGGNERSSAAALLDSSDDGQQKSPSGHSVSAVDSVKQFSKPEKQRGRLGRIGGKRREEKNMEPKERSPPPSVMDQQGLSNDAVSPRGKQSNQNNSTTGRKQNSIPASPSRPRETSQERADRKREELKRHLEEQVKAPPKRKRKF